MKRGEDIRPETDGIVITYIERNPGEGPVIKADPCMPCTEQGRLAPSCRGNDEGEWAFHCSVQSFSQSRACDHVQAEGRHGDLRCEQVEGRQADGGEGRSGSRRLRRTERAERSWTRCSLC